MVHGKILFLFIAIAVLSACTANHVSNEVSQETTTSISTTTTQLITTTSLSTTTTTIDVNAPPMMKNIGVNIDYYNPAIARLKLKEPLLIAGDIINKINIDVNVFGGGIMRSEERRVGKECRSRWSPYH